MNNEQCVALIAAILWASPEFDATTEDIKILARDLFVAVQGHLDEKPV